MNFDIRLAQKNDAIHLADLNSRWQGEQMNDDAKKKNGFLSVSFSEDDFINLISHQEVVVATFRNKIVGYYLLNNYIYNEKFRRGKLIVQKLMNEKKIPSECRVGLGAQVLIEIKYRGNSLSNKMLFLLCKIVRKKYDYLYSSINKKNIISIESNLRNGWKILDESESLFFVFLQPKVYLLYSQNIET